MDAAQSPLAQIVRFMVFLSVARSIVAITHGYATDLPRRRSSRHRRTHSAINPVVRTITGNAGSPGAMRVVARNISATLMMRNA
jgi:hypothetical protein